MPSVMVYLAILLLLVAIYVVSRRRGHKPTPPATHEAFDEEDDEVKTKTQEVQTDDEPPVDTAETPRFNLLGQSMQIVDDLKAIKEDVAFIKDRVKRREPGSYESFYGGRLY